MTANMIERHALQEIVGQAVEGSDVVLIDQERIDAFAHATLDHQFIHVDPERARATPMASTIAHGFLLLSLIPHLTRYCQPMPAGARFGFNYGLNRVRFLAPVPVGSVVRASNTVLEVQERNAKQLLVRAEVSIRIEATAQIALIAETLGLWVFE